MTATARCACGGRGLAGGGKKGVAHDGSLLAPIGKAFKMQGVRLDQHVAVTRVSELGR